MSLKMAILKEGLGSEDLDSIVGEACSRLATNANNDGLSSQLELLTTACGWCDEEILKALHEE